MFRVNIKKTNMMIRPKKGRTDGEKRKFFCAVYRKGIGSYFLLW